MRLYHSEVSKSYAELISPLIFLLNLNQLLPGLWQRHKVLHCWSNHVTGLEYFPRHHFDLSTTCVISIIGVVIDLLPLFGQNSWRIQIQQVIYVLLTVAHWAHLAVHEVLSSFVVHTRLRGWQVSQLLCQVLRWHLICWFSKLLSPFILNRLRFRALRHIEDLWRYGTAAQRPRVFLMVIVGSRSYGLAIDLASYYWHYVPRLWCPRGRHVSLVL